jgi:hypothetical protein
LDAEHKDEYRILMQKNFQDAIIKKAEKIG